MRIRRTAAAHCVWAVALAAGWFAGAASAAGVPAPAWGVESLALPTNFAPGATTGYSYQAVVSNVGGAPTDGSPITIVDTLPPGVSVTGPLSLRLRWGASSEGSKQFGPSVCSTSADAVSTTVTCVIPTEYSPATGDRPSVLYPNEVLNLIMPVQLSAGVEEGRALRNRVEVQGGGAAAAFVEEVNQASSEPASSGFSYFHAEGLQADGEPAVAAGSHPYAYDFGFALNTKPEGGPGRAPFVPAGGDAKDLQTVLPPGLIGNPLSAQRCTAQQFATRHTIRFESPRGTRYPSEVNECPDGSAVGIVYPRVEGAAGATPVPVYNLMPPPGMPAQLGFFMPFSPVVVHIDTEVQPENGYRVVATIHDASQIKRVTAAALTIWGTPGDPSHDRARGYCWGAYYNESITPIATCPSGIESPAPYWRLPTSCVNPLDISMRFDTWNAPDSFVSATSLGPVPDECDKVPFTPSLEAHPTSDVSDAPSGLHADLHIPQPQDPESLGEGDLRTATITLPQGLVVNPSGADGLGTCSKAEIGYLGREEGAERFSNQPATCPDSAKLGTVEVDTPLVDHPLEGAVYAGTPHANPFESLLALYVAIYDPRSGIVVKLAGKVNPDLQTGQLTTTFAETPQLPFEDFKFDFFDGPHAVLRTPQTCGPHSTTSSLTPWSAPASGPPATPSDTFAITQPSGGGPCPASRSDLPHAPTLEAGTESPIAGAYSPIVINLRRDDGSQEISKLTLHAPAGLLARLAGIPYCPDSALAAAAARSGADEKSAPSCLPASIVGTVKVAAGAGPSPYYTDGTVYLAGPYKGAPLSLGIVTPAVAGPYDLGTVVVRTALRVDPETAQITAESDPIPTILDGIPLDLRSIAIHLDHSGWGLNPTSCEASGFSGDVVSTQGPIAPVSTPFQVGGCAHLAFKPKLKIRLRGATRRNRYPALKAVLTVPKQGVFANIARAQVSLPHAEFLEQKHIGTVCTRPALAAHSCPKSSIYGWAKAWTPLLDRPLQGAVYLGTGFEHELPDLVADLDGQIRILLHARIDTTKAQGIRTTFEVVPDAPVSRFVLRMKGGKQGLLVNSESICGRKHRAKARFVGHDGSRLTLDPTIATACKSAPRKHKRLHNRHR